METIHQLVYEVAEALENATDTAAFEALLAAVNQWQFNLRGGFWPVVVNSSGHVLASGAVTRYAGLFYRILYYRGREAAGGAPAPPAAFNNMLPGWYDQRLEERSGSHSYNSSMYDESEDSGAVLTGSVWRDLQVSCCCSTRCACWRASGEGEATECLEGT